MFSGIIKNIYNVFERRNGTLVVASPQRGDRLGDSLAVNGICLTLAKRRKKGNKTFLFFHLSPETRAKTTCDDLKKGQAINFERSLKMNDILSGHIVLGHVDGIGRVKRIEKQKGQYVFWFSYPAHLCRFLAPKGSIAVNGVSLTLVKVGKQEFSVAIIPYTYDHTTFHTLTVGDKVNLEADVFAKYVQKYMRKK